MVTCNKGKTSSKNYVMPQARIEKPFISISEICLASWHLVKTELDHLG